MLQPGGKLDLALEALRTEGAGQLWVEDLERHEALVPNVAGKLDRGHASVPELPLDGVAVAQGIGEERIDCGHNTA